MNKQITRYVYGLSHKVITKEQVDIILSGISTDENITAIAWEHTNPQQRFIPTTKVVATIKDEDKYLDRLNVKFGDRFVFTDIDDVKYRAKV